MADYSPNIIYFTLRIILKWVVVNKLALQNTTPRTLYVTSLFTQSQCEFWWNADFFPPSLCRVYFNSLCLLQPLPRSLWGVFYFCPKMFQLSHLRRAFSFQINPWRCALHSTLFLPLKKNGALISASHTCMQNMPALQSSGHHFTRSRHHREILTV